MSTRSINYDVFGSLVEVGDVIQFLGEGHLVTSVEPYAQSREAQRLGLFRGWRIAHSGPDWRITLVPDQLYEVWPR